MAWFKINSSHTATPVSFVETIKIPAKIGFHRQPKKVFIHTIKFEARSLYTKEVRHFQRGQDVSFAGISNAVANFPSPEIVGQLVGIWVEEIILVYGKPEMESSLSPLLLVKSLLLF